MFFSDDLLTSKKGSFGIIWLMATLGPNNKKITRKQLTAVDLSRTCELIAEPPEPLALRLSGALLVGVARVYNKSYDHLYSDFSNFHSNLRRSIATDFATIGTGTAGTASLDLPGGGKSRYDQITFVNEEGEFDIGLDFEFRHIDWNNPFGKGGKRRSSSKLSSQATQSEQEEDNNEDESSDDEITSSSLLPGYGSNTKTRTSIHHPSDRISPGLYGAVDVPFEGEIDLGLDLGDFEAGAGDDSFSGPSDRGFETPGGGLGDVDMFDAGMDSMQGDFQLQSRQPTPGPQGDNTPFDTGTHSPLGSAVKKRKDHEGSEDGSNHGADHRVEVPKKKKGRKAKMVTWDDTIELGDDGDRQAHRKYKETMEHEHQLVEAKRQEKMIDEQAFKLVNMVGVLDFFDPVMKDLFSSINKVKPFKWELDLAAHRQGKQGLEPEGGEQEEEEQVQPQNEGIGAIGPGGDMGDEIQMQDMDAAFQDVFHSYEVPIHGVSESARQIREGSDMEAARRASQGSQLPLPWEERLRSRSATPGFDDGADTSFSPASLRFSVMTPQEIKIRGRSHTGSIIGSGRFEGRHRSSSLMSDRPDDDPLLLAQADDLELPQYDEHGDLSLPSLPPSQKARLQDLPEAFKPEMLATLEKQCRDFFTYVEKKMITHDTNKLAFEDLAPAKSTKHVAALAFYDCLTLATKRILSVHQDDAWGPIDICFAVEPN